MPFLPFLLVFYWAIPAYEVHRLSNLPPPWQGVPVEEYKSPEAATHAILDGLVVNGLAGSPVGISTLAAIQEQVAFPIPAKEYTPGMVYAQKTYGRDGWGREFAFESLSGGKYRITSAGPDGVFGTKDDIVVVTGSREHNWEDCVSGVYVRPMAEMQFCFVHRVRDPLFRAKHGDEAFGLTENNLFDSFSLDDLFRRTPNSQRFWHN